MSLFIYLFFIRQVIDAYNKTMTGLRYRQMSLYFFLFGLWGYWHCDHSWPIVPASGDSEDDCGEADGMYIGSGKPKFSDKNLHQRHFVSITKSHMTRHGFEPGPPRWEVGD
jgi:hypothetical protein